MSIEDAVKYSLKHKMYKSLITVGNKIQALPISDSSQAQCFIKWYNLSHSPEVYTLLYTISPITSECIAVLKATSL